VRRGTNPSVEEASNSNHPKNGSILMKQQNAVLEGIVALL